MDDKDQKLLMLLRENARASIKELASGINLSRTALIERLRRLERGGEITGYTLKPSQNEKTLRLFLMIKTHQPSCELIAPRLKEIPEITACHSLGGAIDMMVEISTDTIESANEIRETLSAYPEVSEVTTSTLLKTHIKRPQ
ncbi:Lrp/AsnC family transcriptional regulator [Kiloniella antarctica]|uniref:Lrp/AsnC family transcriptional regulator n=1 Tax=Kiloniella antarctica TaxID=1550907 RepID=A0ABW5BDR2_9PROT